MAEYIERLAIGKAYMDLCLAMGKQAKSRKGATFFPGDLLPETEPTTKELFGLVMAMPAADVAPVRHGKWTPVKYNAHCSCGKSYGTYHFLCSACNHIAYSQPYGLSYCPNCGAKMDEVSE